MAAVSVLALATGLASCASQPSGGSGEAQPGVVLAYGTEPQNPLVATNTNEVGGGDILREIFAGLVDYSNEGKWQLNHASEITPNSDATEFRIKLKPGWKFTNGEDVTAQSYVDAWNYGAYGPNGQLAQSFFENIQGFDEVSGAKATQKEMSGLKVVSPTEFTVKLSSPQSSFPIQLGHTVFYPLPKVAFQDMKAFGEHPIGNGPYKLTEGNAWLHNSKLTTVANPDFKGSDKPRNKGLTFVFYSDPDTAYADLLSGRLDTIGTTVPPTAYANFETDFPNSNANRDIASDQEFAIPSWLEHFKGEEGKLRRQAISMAFDRKLITEKLFFSTRQPAKEFTALPLDDVITDVPGAEVLQFNPDKARELWAKADAISPWSGSFQIAYNADGGHQVWVEAVTNQLRDNLGIDAHGKAYPTFKQLRDEVTHKSIDSGFRSGWLGDFPTVSNFLEPKFKTNGSSNDGDYSNPAFDKLLSKAASQPDKKEAAKTYRDAQVILMQDLPVIPLWYPKASVAWNPKLRNVHITWNGYPNYSEIEKD